MYVAGRAHWKISLDDPRVLRVALYLREVCRLEPVTRPTIPRLDPSAGTWPVWGRRRTVDAADADAGLTELELAAASGQWARWWAHAVESGDIAWQDLGDRSLRLFAQTPELRRLLLVHREDAKEWATASADDPRFSRDLHAPGSRLSTVVAGLERSRGRSAIPFELRVTVIPVAGKQIWQLSATPYHYLMTHHLLHDDEIVIDWLRSILTIWV